MGSAETRSWKCAPHTDRKWDATFGFEWRLKNEVGLKTRHPSEMWNTYFEREWRLKNEGCVAVERSCKEKCRAHSLGLSGDWKTIPVQLSRDITQKQIVE